MLYYVPPSVSSGTYKGMIWCMCGTSTDTWLYQLVTLYIVYYNTLQHYNISNQRNSSGQQITAFLDDYDLWRDTAVKFSSIVWYSNRSGRKCTRNMWRTSVAAIVNSCLNRHLRFMCWIPIRKLRIVILVSVCSQYQVLIILRWSEWLLSAKR